MTAQTPDGIIYQGKGYPLHSQPYSSFPVRRSFVRRNPSNDRGYVASWEISDGRLYLTDFSGTVCVRLHVKDAPQSDQCVFKHHGKCDIQEFGMNDLFDVHTTKVFADWYSGELSIPLGTMIEYVHAGFESKYEKYLMIKIMDGVVTGSRTLTHWELELERDEFSRWFKDRIDKIIRQ